MNETEYKILIDSSAWIDYFFTANKKIKEIIDSETQAIISSAISLHEVKKKLLREKYSEKDIAQTLEFMKTKSSIIEITEEICEKSADDSINLKLHTTDSLIYRTAIEKNAKILTLDNDFKNIKQAIVI